MDAVTFSTALWNVLCDDLGFSISPDDRFDPGAHLDPFVESVGAFARRSLLCSVFKKSEIESDKDAENRTLLKFLEANNACKEWKLDCDAGPAVAFSLGYARSLLSDWFEPHCGTELMLTMASIESSARFGPGRSIGLGGKPSQFYFKIGDSKTTCTSPFVRSWYAQSVQFNPLCEAAEMAREARHGPAVIAESGTLSFVPKSYATRRIVVTEPSLNTFFQLGAGGVMGDVLRMRTGIDFSVQQPRNRELARVGSVSGEYSTIDLTQCSDYIALGMVGYMFPKSVVDWVNVLRTPSVKIDGLGTHRLWMASTMGNGFTFPLQTALLASVVLGVYRTLDIPIERPGLGPGNFGVFGDDIVCRSEAYGLVCKTLEALGLKVNSSKSFSVGPFRESCGKDFYLGHDVRGVYAKNYTSPQDYISIFNRLALWSAKQAIPLTRTLKFLKDALGSNFFFVPPDEPVVAGIWSPIPMEFENPDGTWKYEAFYPRVSALTIEPCAEEAVENQNRAYRRWVRALLQYSDGSINEPAALKALLYGALRRGKAIIRNDSRTAYRKILRVTPRWGYSEGLASELSGLERDRWIRSLISQEIPEIIS